MNKKLFPTVVSQLIHVEGMMKIEKSSFGRHNRNNYFRERQLMYANRSRQKHAEKQNISIIPNDPLISCLLILKGTVTSQWLTRQMPP